MYLLKLYTFVWLLNFIYRIKNNYILFIFILISGNKNFKINVSIILYNNYEY